MAGDAIEVLTPAWDAPPHVKACTALRSGGVSTGVFASLNLSDSVGDAAELVAENRTLLMRSIGLAKQPMWLNQQHGKRVIGVDQYRAGIAADGAVSRTCGSICTVTTADCLPVLLSAKDGREVAALHAGWRGLVRGIVRAGVSTMNTPPEQIQAWIGPAISAGVYEIGNEVRDAFLRRYPGASSAFHASRPQHWYADLPRLASMLLRICGVNEVTLSGQCSFSDPSRFYSHRRDGRTGRNASLIWIE